jgi:cyclophilin family peptidyl-prolyl cis-trans isomerase
MFLRLLHTLALSALLFSVASHASDSSDSSNNRFVTFETDLGPLVIELYPKQAPVTVANFLAYVDSDFYDGTIFHRVIPSFVVQGGGFTFDFKRKETQPAIVNESDNGLTNQYLTLSMARTSAVDSATSQFFINLKHNTSLDAKEGKAGYAVFGKVIKGEAVIERIVAEPRGVFRAFPDAPNAAVRILKSHRGKVDVADTSGTSLKDKIAP